MFSNWLQFSLAAAVIVVLAIAGLWGLTGGAGALHRVPGDYMASPVLVHWVGQTSIAVASKKGWVAAIEPGTSRARWSLDLAAPAGEEVYLLATPTHVDGHLVIAYQTRRISDHTRMRHRVVVVDVQSGKLHPEFPLVELSASKPAIDGSGPVKFSPKNALSRSALAHGRPAGTGLGNVYVSFGNWDDIQPWHGWVFELSLDAWRSAGADAAVTSIFLATPETHCPVEGESGEHDMICGGGVWTPAGPLVQPRGDTYELLVPTGNGQLDLARRDYANGLLRLEPGLDFDPQCDAKLCTDFDQVRPSEACLASCANLFIPRLRSGDAPLRPASGVCDKLTFMECYAVLDYDLGANAPARVELENDLAVIVQPGKDGSVYLIDAKHLGTLYDREVIVEICGAVADSCDDDQWRGMMVTQPTVAHVRGEPVVLVPTFMFDRTHPAGLVALKVVVVDGVPQLEPFWQAPDFDTPEALARFRYYSSRVVIEPAAGEREARAWIVEAKKVSRKSFWKRPWAAIRDAWTGRSKGELIGVRVSDGEIVARIRLEGSGARYTLPLLHEGLLYVSSNQALEIHDIRELQ